MFSKTTIAIGINLSNEYRTKAVMVPGIPTLHNNWDDSFNNKRWPTFDQLCSPLLVSWQRVFRRNVKLKGSQFDPDCDKSCEGKRSAHHVETATKIRVSTRILPVELDAVLQRCLERD